VLAEDQKNIAMKVSYRVTTSVVVTAYVLLVTSEFLFDSSHMPAATTIATAETGAVRFDPCMMWGTDTGNRPLIHGCFRRVNRRPACTGDA
jgi:hypothetical protein